MSMINFSDQFTTSSPNGGASPSHQTPDSSSSSCNDSSDEQGEGILIITDRGYIFKILNKLNFVLVKCSCGEHQGKEMLNQVFNLSVHYLFECIFGHTDCCRKYWDSRKFSNMKIAEWKQVNACIVRQLTFNVDLGVTIGKPKNTEDQVCLN